MSERAAANLLENLRRQRVDVWLDDGRVRFRGPRHALNADIVTQLRQLEPAIKQLLAEESGDKDETTDQPAPPGSPVSSAQESLLIMDELTGGNPADNLRMVHRIRGPLDPAALQSAFNSVAARHDTLRTSFRYSDAGFTQEVAPAVEVPLHRVEVSSEAALAELLRTEGATTFDLSRPPLLRATLCRLADDDHVLQIVLHHTVSDGWSTQLLAAELGDCYSGRSDQLPELPTTYAEHATLEREAADSIRGQIDYWSERLAGVQPLELPTDRPRPGTASYRGARLPVRLPPGLFEELRRVGRSEGATPYMALMAAFAALLQRYAGTEGVTVGMPVSTRPPGVEQLIGMFLNVLVLRLDLSGDPSFRELLQRTRAASLEAFTNRDAPFESVVTAVQPDRDTSRNPLFQVMLQLSEEPSLELDGLSTQPYPHDPGTAQFDLTLHLYQSSDGVGGFVEYATDLFEPATIERMMGHLFQLAEAATQDIDRAVSDIEIVTGAELAQISHWNDTAADYPSATLPAMFEAQVLRTPDAVALVSADESLTYAEFNARANRLAHYLTQRGVGPEGRVGIFMERSVAMMEGIYATLKAGGAYVPLDPDYPAERLSHMMEDAAIDLVVTQDHLLERVPGSPGTVVSLERDRAAIQALPYDNPVPAIGSTSLAYVIFTSGSTGRPKGVMNEHGGVSNRLFWTQDAFGLDDSDCVVQKTPISFDVSVWELFWPLFVGARLVLADPGGHRDPAYLRRLIEEQAVTTMHFVPSMLTQFLDSTPVPTETASLRRVLCSGEALAQELVERFFQSVDAELHNLYGPTEAAVDVTWWPCDPASKLGFIPIGRPVANTQIHIVDPNLRRCPIGVPGELLIGGIQVARGYVGRDQLTAERFVPDVLGPDPSRRLYRTGDLARYLPDGAIQYLGRADNQIKLRGFRIELGEIEAVLGGHPGVHQAVVTVQRRGGAADRLIGYIRTDDPAPSADSLRDFLRKLVPDYMIPSVFVTVEALPLLPNGKVNRHALPEPEETRPELSAAYAAPSSDTETAIAAIWREVLRLDAVGLDDNFFDLGGNSLLLLRVRSEVESELGTDVAVLDLFQHPTVRRLAAFLSRNGSSVGDDDGLVGAQDRAARQQAALARMRRPRGGP